MTHAEAFLLELFTDKKLKNPLPLSVIQRAAKSHGLQKKELREARKSLGIESIEENGGRLWFYPKEARR